ncbi:unnamed protein product [Calicophoron daubneyi]|uniref:non-specific serine/threonine protein kinase n=1 Tax=Calicophoron daubneyi TaxID=300641 RepID=A0AAV2TKJ9_CALDB
MDEIRFATKSSRDVTKLNPELSQAFKLLSLVAENGTTGKEHANISALLGNLVLALDESAQCFLSVMKGNDLTLMRQSMFTFLQSVFQSCESHSIALSAEGWESLILWCCQDLRSVGALPTANLLSLLVLRASSSCIIPLNSVMDALSSFLRRDPQNTVADHSSYVINLGWVVHLLRWLIARIYTTSSDWNAMAMLVDACTPKLIKLLSRTATSAATKTQGAEAATVTQSRDCAISQILRIFVDPGFGECSSDDEILAPLMRQEFRFSPPTTSGQYTDVEHSVCDLNRPDCYFRIDTMPKLCCFPCSPQPMLRAEEVVLSEELFCLWRWFLVWIHHRRSDELRAQFPTRRSLCAIISFSLRYWNSIVARISFQNEASCWKQIKTSQNYFGLLAAVILVIYDDDYHHIIQCEDRAFCKQLFNEILINDISAPSENNKSKRIRPAEFSDKHDVERIVTDESLWSLVSRLISAEEKGGCLWWLVLDWLVRLKRQQGVVLKSTSLSSPLSSSSQLSSFSTLKSMEHLLGLLNPCIPVAKTLLAHECMLIALHSSLTVLCDELLHSSGHEWNPSARFLETIRLCWTTVFRIASLSEPWRNSFRGARHRVYSRDRLAYEVLQKLLSLLAASNFNEELLKLSAELSHPFRKLLRASLPLRSTLEATAAPWRWQSVVLADSVVPNWNLAHMTSDFHDSSKAVLCSSSISAFLSQYINSLETESFEETEELSPNEFSTVLEAQCCILAGLYWVCLNNFVADCECDILHSRSYVLRTSHKLHFSTQQAAEAVQLIRKKISTNPLLLEIQKLPLTENFVIVLTALLLCELRLAHLHSHLLPQANKSLFISNDSVCFILNSLVDSFLISFDSVENSTSSSNKRHQIEQPTFHDPGNIPLTCLELIIESLPADFTSNLWLSSSRQNKLMQFCLSRPVSCNAPIPSSKSKQNNATDRNVRLNFGDDDFADCSRSNEPTNEILMEDEEEERGNSSGSDRQKINSRLFRAVLSYALITNSVELLDSIQHRLDTVLNPQHPCETKEAIDWLCFVGIAIMEVLQRGPSCSITTWNLVSREKVFLLMSSLVDAIHRSFKARLNHGYQDRCIAPLIDLLHIGCGLSKSISHILESATDQNRWTLVGRHLDNLLRTVWSVLAKQGDRLLYGLNEVAIEYSQTWFQAHSQKILENDTAVEYALSNILRQSISTPLLNLIDYLEQLDKQLTNTLWARQNEESVVRLIEILLTLLDSKSTCLEAVHIENIPKEEFQDPDSANFEFTLTIYRLVFTILIQLAASGCCSAVQDPLLYSQDTSFQTRPLVGLAVRTCKQIACIVSSDEHGKCLKVYKIILQSLSVSEEEFAERVRPYLLPPVLKQYVQTRSHESLTVQKAFEQFPWPCWGLPNLKEASRLMSAELFSLLITGLWSAESVPTIQKLGLDTGDRFYHIVAIMLFEECRPVNPGASENNWINALKMIGKSDILDALVSNPSHVKLMTKRLLGLIALYCPPECKSNSESISAYFIRCLILLSCRMNRSVQNSSKFESTICSTFDPKCKLTMLHEQLVELSFELAPKPTANSLELFFPRTTQFASWAAITKLTLMFLSDMSFKSTKCVELIDYTFWRLAVGHLDLLKAEPVARLSHLSELISSMTTLFKATSLHTDPDRDVHTEIAVHHATVFHLVGTIASLSRLKEADNKNSAMDTELNSLFSKIFELLHYLVDPNATPRFRLAVCQLPSFPKFDHLGDNPLPDEQLVLLRKCQNFIEQHCSCDRSCLLQNIRLLSDTLDPGNLSRCPRLLRYQNFYLDDLTQKLSQLSVFHTCAPAVDSVVKLEITVSRFDQNSCETSVDTVQVKTYDVYELFMVTSIFAERLNRILSFSTSDLSQSNTGTSSFVDAVTRRSCLLCLGSCNRLLSVLRNLNYDPLVPTSFSSVSVTMNFEEPLDRDPSLDGLWNSFVDVIHLASFANSSITPLACTVLRQIFSSNSIECIRPLLNNHMEENSSLPVRTILCPYLQNSSSKSGKLFQPDFSRFCSMSEFQLAQYLGDEFQKKFSTETQISEGQSWLPNFIIWLLDLPLVKNELCQCMRPLLPLSRLLFQSITTCLVQSSGPNSTHHLCIDVLLAYYQWTQWNRVSRHRDARSSDVAPDWIVAARRAITLGRSHEARLFLELAWLTDDYPDDWLNSTAIGQLVWLNLCRLTGDLPGLRAAQAIFPSFTDDESTVTSEPSLSGETNLAVNELLGNWSRLLAAHDAAQMNTPSGSLVSPDVALCLQRLGAHNLFQRLLTTATASHLSSVPDTDGVGKQLSSVAPTSSDSTELREMRAATAWRLGLWETSTTKSIHNSSTLSALLIPSRAGWDQCGLETAFYWICEASTRSDWKQVEHLVSEQCTHLLKGCEQSYSTQFSCTRDFSVSSSQFCCLNQLIQPRGQTLIIQDERNKLTLQLLGRVVDCINTLASSPSSSDGSFALGIHRGCLTFPLETIEPFISIVLRLTIALVLDGHSLSTEIGESSTDLLSCLLSLISHTYLYCAEAAIEMKSLRLSEAWLEDSIKCQQLLFEQQPESVENPTSTTNQLWQRLRVTKLRSTLERARGEQRLATSHLLAALTVSREQITAIGQSSTKDPTLLRGLAGCYLHGTAMLCSWLFESRTKSAADLLTNYLDPALRLTERWSVDTDSDALASVAQFADAQFTTLDSYLASSEFASRRQLLSEAQHDVACLTDLGEKSRLLRLLQRQSAIETEELDILTQDADRYLEIVLRSYAQCLTASDAHNLKIYRFISLWFSAAADPALQADPNSRALRVNQIMSTSLPAIRPDKFLHLITQLAVRLSSLYADPGCPTNFQTILTQLVERIIDWHPHHAASTLLFLVNAELDELYTPKPQNSTLAPTTPQRQSRPKARRNQHADSGTESSDQPKQCLERNGRIQAARRMFTHLSEGRRGPLLAQMQLLAEAYVEWANADVDKHRGSTAEIPLPSGCKLQQFVTTSRKRSVSNNPNDLLNLVAIPTRSLRIDRSGLYCSSDVVYIAGFGPTFRLAGGINVPKIIICLGSDGQSRRQLVKGRDDPRQDAVMQQVFLAANCLLARRYSRLNQNSDSISNAPDGSSEPIQRATWLDADGGLRMRTYKVIPMARRTGVIEWCEGTVPLGEWLAADRSGGHQRYRPRDLPPGQAKQRLAAVRDRPPERRLLVFNEICGQLRPVLAYFYLEKFPSPQAWCKARFAYTRSLAVSSLVGYLVGLGDRHPHNLLLHQASGELVHIDLGVAFDQGRLLPTPEMVPFRLTRDLVHALGPLGLEAGFVPAAETVLRELRAGGDVILTLLQVLLYDPLYSWSMTPAQICALEARRAEAVTGPVRGKSGPVLTDQTNFTMFTSKEDTTTLTRLMIDNTTLDVGNTSMASRTLPPPIAKPEHRNQLAERVLLSVRSKLEGRVTGVLAASSDEAKSGGLDQLDIAGHLGLLVRAATDPANLSRMYFGWQAYL